jgi:hypothetical protein
VVSLPPMVLMATLTTCSFMQMKMAIQPRSALCDTPNSPIKTMNCKRRSTLLPAPNPQSCVFGLVAQGSCNATPQENRSKSPLHSYHFQIQKLSASYLVQWSYQTIRTQRILQLSKKYTYVSVTLQSN